MFVTSFLTKKRHTWKYYTNQISIPANNKSFFVLPLTVLDAPYNWQINFQTPATDTMEQIIDLHHDIVFFLIVIIIFVSWILYNLLNYFSESNKKTIRISFKQHEKLEQYWTIIPVLILITIAIPSFSLLYSIAELIEPRFSIKVIGHQWYWSYETTDLEAKKELNFDSYMFLEVDNRLKVPTKSPLLLIIITTDVIHSWAVPSLGVKMDGCPRRLNQSTFRHIIKQNLLLAKHLNAWLVLHQSFEYHIRRNVMIALVRCF